jgi:DNA repair photolyase
MQGVRPETAAPAIVSASYRTDIPAFYTRWLLCRLAAGLCRVANPYGGAPYEVSLRPGAVAGFVFWTRNLGPLLPHLETVRARAPFAIQFTLTGYPRALEPGVIEREAALEQLRALARRWGARAAVWRYDPVLLSTLTPPDWHRANFARLAAALAGLVDEVVLSFAQPYRKTARNLAEAARRHGFAWHDPSDAEKRALLGALAAIAAEHGIKASLCAQPGLLAPGLAEARCIDAERLSDLAGERLAAREKGNRPGCRCAESRDIGAYDSCAQGCAYCYAVSSPRAAQRRLRAHDPAAELLLPRPAAPSNPAAGAE